MKLGILLASIYTIIAFGYIIALLFKTRNKEKLKEKPFLKIRERNKKIGIVLLLYFTFVIFIPIAILTDPSWLFYLSLIFIVSNIAFMGIVLSKPYIKKFNQIKKIEPGVSKKIFEVIEPEIKLLHEPDFRLKTSEFAKHVEVLATTGAGKTKGYVGPLLAQAIELGTGVLILDPKGDTEMLNATLKLLKRLGRIHDLKFFDLGRPNLSCTYNPLINGTPSQIATRVLATMPTVGGTATFYEEKQREAMRMFFPAIKTLADMVHKLGQRRGKAINFVDLYAFFSAMPDSIVWLKKMIERYGTTSDVNLLQRIGVDLLMKEIQTNKRYKEWLAGLQQHLSKFAFSLEDPTLLNAYEPDINLLEDLHNGKILYFITPPLAYPGGEAYELGKMILMDLLYVIYWRQRNNITPDVPIFAIIDEAHHVTPPEFIPAMEMGRSATVSVSLIHQALTQFDEIEKGFAERIVQNTGTKVIMTIKHPQTAEFFSKLAGEELKKFVSESIASDHPVLNLPEAMFPDSRVTISEKYDYIVRPEEFTRLQPGEAYVFSPDGKIMKGKLYYFAEDLSNISPEMIIPPPPPRSPMGWKSSAGLNLIEELQKFKTIEISPPPSSQEKMPLQEKESEKTPESSEVKETKIEEETGKEIEIPVSPEPTEIQKHPEKQNTQERMKSKPQKEEKIPKEDTSSEKDILVNSQKPLRKKSIADFLKELDEEE